MTDSSEAQALSQVEARPDDLAGLFDPLVWRWFRERLGTPTPPQREGWPSIASGEHTLIAAPTGSGKTLAAFLLSIDRLVRHWRTGELPEGVETVYVSPLKALSNDIERNLEAPLAEIRRLALESEGESPAVRVAVRTGDTPASQRQAMLRHPPHILVTTPESLYLLLTSPRSRELLRTTRTVIVDEIHALARDKRGSHLALTLERLERLCDKPPVRIGLSATQRPIERVAAFLTGPGRPCRIVDGGHLRELRLDVELPQSPLSAVCSNEQWGEVYQRLKELIESHRSTLVFVNTRRMAERVAHQLREQLGEDAVASHHGSLARPLRLEAEQRLKRGELKAIVATASLEMGIDIGYIDLVCQLGSPRSIATFLQRVGRSGHSLGATPHGLLFPLSLDELLECLALIRAVRQGRLDTVEIPECPLDILAQQIVAETASEPCDEDDLYARFRAAWPFRDLARADFDRVVAFLSEGLTPRNRRGQHLHRDRIHQRLRARRGARLAAIMSGGAIPETGEYRVLVEPERTLVGTVDEDFAIESMAGDVFLLGNNSWRVRRIGNGEVLVQDAAGAPPSVPFWFGEAPGRTVELSAELSTIREQVAARVALTEEGCETGEAEQWLRQECGTQPAAGQQAAAYVAAEVRAIGLVPTTHQVVFERFFDESGGMQLVIHSPYGARINRAWGMALRKRFCRSFDFELQAAATDNGIVLSLSPQHSLPLERLFQMLHPGNARHLLEQAVLAQPMFQVRWRWNITRALAVLRRQGGGKVPPYLQRFRADDLLAAVFPETVGCLENHHGDVEIPDHPLVRQTMHDCLHEALDVDRWIGLLGEIERGQVELVARDTREPSPFCQQLLNANPYAFLDGAALEDRRTRAVAGRRSLSEVSDLARLDAQAIREVAAEAWPVVRDADELHEALLQLVAPDADDCLVWTHHMEELCAAGRAARVRVPDRTRWVSAERWPVLRAVWPAAEPTPPLSLPPELEQDLAKSDAWVELVRGCVEHQGPATAVQIAQRLGLDEGAVEAALEVLEGHGSVLRGRFTEGAIDPSTPIEWCDRRLLSRIHRRTLDGLRRQIKPVETADFVKFLVERHGIQCSGRQGPGGVREALGLLQGSEAPACAWEEHLLRCRLERYEPEWLDQLFQSGEAMWGRLRPPRRREDAGPPGLTRAALVSLFFRADLPWLLPGDREWDEEALRTYARETLGALRRRGALFFAELLNAAQLLPDHLEEGLRELAAHGAVTSDLFIAAHTVNAAGRSGRWSLFPGELAPLAAADRLEAWAKLLLRRYGVVFADLLPREPAAPPWRELVPLLRRMELRGQVRGGRFVRGVSGEQFAEEGAVERLRAARDEVSEACQLISACDPLNLTGPLTQTARVTANHTNLVLLREGRCVAARVRGQVEWVDPPADSDERERLERSLVLGRLVDKDEPRQLHIRRRAR